MVKFKPVKRPDARTAAAGRRSASAMPAPPAANPMLMVVAVVGWLGSAVALVMLLMGNAAQHRMMAEIQRQREAERETIQREAEVAEATIKSRMEAMQKQVNAASDEVSAMLKAAQEAEQQLAELSAQAAAATDAVGSAEAAAAAASAGAGGAGEVLSSVSDALQELERQRAGLIAQYRKGFEALQNDLESRLERGGNALWQYYNGRRHTPFGPAAGYLAGEAFYSERRLNEARRAYGDVIKHFADTAYAGASRQRLDQIEAGEPYDDAGKLGVTPYKALSFR